ncbi:TGF-beta-activated kinase 1 and MAP3K7-binding protein 1-like [Anopheles darlingi]|uniref:TGF-beta-activated kinase 1 and MAP3K7-binding protein 1-like n=1 Tax=Anopheles darlingi TaxID=43151 RepID=UPI0021002992|nr:TGF-beta-activated kinase 1 and MAP3K7-binding protein 1-like [Anopheles darlingi]
METLENSNKAKSWTDDLKVCNQTGVGEATNQIYKEDGSKCEGYKSRDKKCLCIADNTLSMYAILSGHNDVKVAEYALQGLAADLVLGQLNSCHSEDAVKELMRAAFNSVEKDYLDSINTHVARKTAIQLQLSADGMNQYEISQQFENVLQRLDWINNELSIGASAVVALVHRSHLYLGNIGNCRALLCKTDEHDTLTVTQLSVDHNLLNAEEAARLFRLGLMAQNFEGVPLYSTRCIGNYLGKAGYKDCNFLSSASTEPVIFEPEIVGGLQITSACRFLVLMSSGLCRALHDIFPGDMSTGNRELVRMISEEFQNQSTLAGVAQSVVHRIVQTHHDVYMQLVEESKPLTFSNRDDVTLLIRNFNYALPKAFMNRKNGNRSINSTTSMSSNSSEATPTDGDHSTINSNISVTSSNITQPGNPYDSNQRIRSHVDFADFYRRVAEAKQLGQLPTNIEFD